MKPKGLAVDKDSPDYKKILELSADGDLLASVDQKKGKFLSYLKNKLAPIQEEKQEKRCICFFQIFAECLPLPHFKTRNGRKTASEGQPRTGSD